MLRSGFQHNAPNREADTLPRSGAGGFSLVELLIAVALSLMITAAMLNFYLSHRSTHRHHMALSRLQENARFLHIYLGDELRLAGQTGCPIPLRSIFSALKEPGDPWTFSDYPRGLSVHRYHALEQQWEPPLGVSAQMPVVLTNVHPASDVLVIRRMATHSRAVPGGAIHPLPGAAPLATVTPEVAQSIAIEKPTGRVFLWSHCHHQATVFSICRIEGSARNRRIHFSGGAGCAPSNQFNGTVFESLLEQFDLVSGQLGPLETRVYYLNQNQELVESFYDGQGGWDTQPLVRGMASFRVALVEAAEAAESAESAESPEAARAAGAAGAVESAEIPEPTGNSALHYVYRSAPQVSDWSRITALRLDYQLSESELSPPLTQWVSQEIALRNSEGTSYDRL